MLFHFFSEFFPENSLKNYLIRLFGCSEKGAPLRGQMHTVSGERLFNVSVVVFHDTFAVSVSDEHLFIISYKVAS